MRRRPVPSCLRWAIRAPALGVAACLSVGCQTSAAAVGYPQITGIQIDAQALVAGHGCGTGPNQVYKYAVVLAFADSPDAPVTSGVFDCYTNGLFSNLPTRDGGSSTTFAISIYAYAAYDAQDASFPAALVCPANAAVACPGDDVATVVASIGAAKWATECSGTQQVGATSLALCAPLQSTQTTNDAGTADAAATD